MPDLSSRSASFCSSATRVSGWIILAWSTTRPVSAGKLMAKADAIAKSATINAAAILFLPPVAEKMPAAFMLMPSRRSALELYLRRFGRALAGSELRHRLIGPEERRGPDHAGECSELSIIGPNRLNVVAARNRDAVFSAFKLGLKRKKILIRLEIRVVLADGDQPAKCPAKLVLRILELLDLFRIGELRRINPDAGCLCARLDDRGQHFPFLLGVALNCGDKIRN